MLGRLHARSGDRVEARRAYEKALSLDAKQPEALAGLAALVMDEDPEAALEIYSRGLEDRAALAGPEPGMLLRSRAELLRRLDRVDEAAAELEARLLAEPLDVEAATALAEILRLTGSEDARARAESLTERSRRFELARSRFSFDPPADAAGARAAENPAA